MKTFNLVVIAILSLFVAGCDDDDHLGDWAKAIQFAGAPREAAVCFTNEATGAVYVGLGYGARNEEFNDMYVYEKGKSWTKLDIQFPAKPNPGTGGEKNGNGRHSAVSFVIGDYAYVGTGYVTSYSSTSTEENRNRTYFKDFYRFNMKTQTWDKDWSTTLPDGADGRRDAVAFSDGKYGYVGTGYGENDRVYKDFYKFDPATKTWTEISFPGEARFGGTAFVVNDAAYVCLGSSTVGGTGYVLDVQKFDFSSGTWSTMGALANKPRLKQDKDYGRIPRAYAVSFISNRGSNGKKYAYIATGMGPNSSTAWRYNHEKDQWHQVEGLPAAYANLVVMAAGFSVEGYGFFTTGAGTVDASGGFYLDTWRFIPDVKEDRANDYSASEGF